MKYIHLDGLNNDMPVFDEKDEICGTCSYPLSTNGACLSCNIFRSKNSHPFTGGKFFFEKIYSVGKYKYMKGLGQPAKQSEDNLPWLILNYKKEPSLLRYCSELLIMKIKEFLAETKIDASNLVICCVPDSDENKYKKGEILSNDVSNKINLPFINLLKKIKKTEKQHAIKGEHSIQKKFENVRGAFEVRLEHVENLAGKTVLLIDDVVSSMASANECSKILKENGALKVFIFSLGRNILLDKTGVKK